MIFWRMLETEQLTVAIDFHSMEINTIEVNGYRQLFGNQYSSFVYKQRNTTHTGLESE